jgi:hypothetical protein
MLHILERPPFAVFIYHRLSILIAASERDIPIGTCPAFVLQMQLCVPAIKISFGLRHFIIVGQTNRFVVVFHGACVVAVIISNASAIEQRAPRVAYNLRCGAIP